METIKLCCSYCSRDFTKTNIKTLDHIQPFSYGKKSSGKRNSSWQAIYNDEQISNLLISCKQCNNLKLDFNLYQFRELMRRLNFNYPTFKYLGNNLTIPIEFNNDIRIKIIHNINLLLTKNDFEELPIKYF